mgnify:CR=1 FL=1
MRFTNADLPPLGPRDRAKLGGLKEAPADGEEPAEGEAESGFDEAVAQLEEEGDEVQGVVQRKIKGGLLVDVEGVNVFLPASQVNLRRTHDISDFLGDPIRARIIKIDPERMNIVVSRRVLLEERQERVTNLRALMKRSDLTVAEKSRRVFEAYQIENDYGRTLEAYKGKLDLGDRSFDVDFLRIGRLALLYRSVGNDRFGHWDRQARQWVETDQSQFRRNVDRGLRIARQEMAPELVTIPVPPAEEVQP